MSDFKWDSSLQGRRMWQDHFGNNCHRRKWLRLDRGRWRIRRSNISQILETLIYPVHTDFLQPISPHSIDHLINNNNKLVLKPILSFRFLYLDILNCVIMCRIDCFILSPMSSKVPIAVFLFASARTHQRYHTELIGE